MKPTDVSLETAARLRPAARHTPHSASAVDPNSTPTINPNITNITSRAETAAACDRAPTDARRADELLAALADSLPGGINPLNAGEPTPPRASSPRAREEQVTTRPRPLLGGTFIHPLSGGTFIPSPEAHSPPLQRRAHPLSGGTLIPSSEAHSPPSSEAHSYLSRGALTPRAQAAPRWLHLFAGPPDRPDGFAAQAASRGARVDELDTLIDPVGHNAFLPHVRARCYELLRSGVYTALLIGTPCTSFSIAQGNAPDGSRRYGLRSWRYPSGAPWASAEARRFLEQHDVLVEFTAKLLEIALELDIDVVLENPAPRHVRGLPSFWAARAHLPQLWDMAPIKAVLDRAGGDLKMIVVPQCAFGPGPHGFLFQKWTALLCSARPAARLADLERLSCNHDHHDRVACGCDADGVPNAPLAAAYPGPMNGALVSAFGRPHLTPEADAASVEEAALEPDEPLPSSSDEPEPPPDRSISTGRVADGASLNPPTRATIERARRAPPKWASFRNLEQASKAELLRAPMPDMLPHRRREPARDPPSQPGAAERLREFREALGGRDVHIEDLWMPGKYEELQAWMRRARRGAHLRPAIFPQADLVPLARGYIWDSRDPRRCVPMVPSDRHTVFPGARQMDRAAFRRAAAEVGATDHDIVAQAGEGGVESRSQCELTTELHTHAPGLWERPAAAEKEVAKELAEEWALGPFYHPPTVPIRALPRDVIAQARSRVLPDGTVEDFDKDRITLNPSKGLDSVNSGIPASERSVRLTTARDLGYGLAVIDVPATDAKVGTAAYGTDITGAYSFLVMQALDWWQFAYLWFDAEGRAYFRLLVRVGFGGAMSPQRFQGVAVVLTLLARKRQAEFDALNPYPPAIQGWQAFRRQLQCAGLLPAGPEQVSPTTSGPYIDDIGGGCPNDSVAMPASLYGVDTASVSLGELAARANGGEPLRRDSRGAAHCIIVISAIRFLRLEEADNKTEGGSSIVNLGLRIDLARGRIDCPGPKRRIMLRDLGLWLDKVRGARAFERAFAEKQVGRVGNLTQVLPELLIHLRAGFSAANAARPGRGGRGKVKCKVVPLRAGSPMHAGLLQLLPHAINVIERNEGAPLAPRASFAEVSQGGSLTVTSDASGHDGCGGYIFVAAAPLEPFIVSAAWPDDIVAALAEAKRRPAERTAGAPALSMPAAELFTGWAVLEAARDAATLEGGIRAVIAVGDCAPAAAALNAASSPVPQMDALLAAARAVTRQWLGVAIPREWNVDADRLSHPAQLPAVLADAVAAGLKPRVVAVPAHCWATLRAACTLHCGDQL